MGFFDFLKIGEMKKEITQLKADISFYENENFKLDNELTEYKTLDSLGRLIKCPRSLGHKVYVIMRRHLHPEYDREIIGMRMSTDVDENNIKIIAITISHYVAQPSGLYLGFEEQYEDGVILHIKADSRNLFISMSSAIQQMYNNSDKSEYGNDPFVVLTKETPMHIYDASNIG